WRNLNFYLERYTNKWLGREFSVLKYKSDKKKKKYAEVLQEKIAAAEQDAGTFVSREYSFQNKKFFDEAGELLNILKNENKPLSYLLKYLVEKKLINDAYNNIERIFYVRTYLLESILYYEIETSDKELTKKIFENVSNEIKDMVQ
ncbi:MAG: hypothetical protein LBK13_11665, partial [Spirochaetales bacterium]|nr:hypothetical protein [Spirochaetales bacterium]